MKTSEKFSKKLAEGGCELESEYIHKITPRAKNWSLVKKKLFTSEELQTEIYYPAYDLLWDICVKYPKQFFGKDYLVHTEYTFTFIQLLNQMSLKQSKIQEAENYIWEHCKFNPSNK